MSLEQMEEELERYYINMENELLMNIAKKLSVNKPMEIDKWDEKNNQPLEGSGGVNEWQLERLKELGGLTSENVETISKYSGKTINEVEKIFQRAREIGTEVDDKILKLGVKAGILNEINPVLENSRVKEIIKNSINETLTTFNKQNNSLLASAGVEYKQIVNDVTTEVLAGTKTISKAMQDSVSKLAEKGLTGFTARNGAEWTPEAYTKMVLRTNTRQATNHIQEARLQLAGNDYIEISSHMGARPLCAEDQGKIFSLSGNTTPITDGLGNEIKVYDWSQSSYGKPAGILGINCGHSRHAFVPGMSIHREQQFTKAENDEAYIEKQQQRYYERQIRNKKREIAMLKETGAEKDYIKTKQNQLSNYRNEYLDFLDKTGRTRITANEWIGTTKKSNGYIQETALFNKKYIKDNIKNIDKKLHDETINQINELTNKYDFMDNFFKEKKTFINTTVLNQNRIAQLSFNSRLTDVNIQLNQLRYNRDLINDVKKKVTDKYYMPCSSKYYSIYPITHEYGHAVQCYLFDEYNKTHINEYNNFINKIHYYKNSNFSKRDIDDKIEEIHMQYYSTISDLIAQNIYEIANKNNDYFDLNSSISKYAKKSSFEFFAECFANMECGEPNELGKAMNEYLKGMGLK